MSALAWTADLLAAIGHYQRSRRRSPVVRVTLVNGESRYVLRARAGENDALVVLDVYPEPVDALVEVEEPDDRGDVSKVRVTPEQVVVAPSSVLKVELVYERRDRARLGFQLDDEATSSR